MLLLSKNARGTGALDFTRGRGTGALDFTRARGTGRLPVLGSGLYSPTFDPRPAVMPPDYDPEDETEIDFDAPPPRVTTTAQAAQPAQGAQLDPRGTLPACQAARAQAEAARPGWQQLTAQANQQARTRAANTAQAEAQIAALSQLIDAYRTLSVSSFDLRHVDNVNAALDNAGRVQDYAAYLLDQSNRAAALGDVETARQALDGSRQLQDVANQLTAAAKAALEAIRALVRDSQDTQHALALATERTRGSLYAGGYQDQIKLFEKLAKVAHAMADKSGNPLAQAAGAAAGAALGGLALLAAAALAFVALRK